jgi:hypothetical protein
MICDGSGVCLGARYKLEVRVDLFVTFMCVKCWTNVGPTSKPFWLVSGSVMVRVVQRYGECCAVLPG